MRPLRIGFFVDNPAVWGRAPHWDVGGSELQIRHQLEALQPPYFAPELYFATAPETGFPEDLPWPAFTAPQHGRWLGVWGLYRLLRQRRPDLVHSLFLDSLFRGVPAAWAARVPAIISARRNANYWKQRRHRLALPLINRMVTAWQTNAASINAVLRAEEGIPEHAIEILPNWLDLERFGPASPAARARARQKLGLPATAWIVVSVANYRPVKNLPLLIDAAAAIAAKVPQSLFLLIGAGPEGASLQARVERLGVQRQVRLVGESDEIPAYLTAADVGCLTSHSEGCSNAVLEYMAAGLATALSDIPANRSLTPEGLFAAGDAASLARWLEQLAVQPELAAALGERNRQRAEQYGAAAFRERVEAHFVRAAGGVLRR
jgi:glycosyltransferase involved in cell wall biosynthesis